MCLAAVGAAAGVPATAGAGAQIAAGAAIVGTATAAIGTGLGIMQAQQNMQMQANMARQQQDLAYRQAQNQARIQNLGIMKRHVGEVNAQQAARLAQQNQMFYNDQSVNSKYVADQIKLKEARDKSAFEMQKIYAKQIGSRGSVLATGLSGQSIGLLALDAERQAGFAQAQSEATVRSAETAAARSMTGAYWQAMSLNEQEASKVGFPVQAPTYAPEPIGIGKDLGISGIPSYTWT